jgi:iron-sulfur cluster assembly accessory protein
MSSNPSAAATLNTDMVSLTPAAQIQVLALLDAEEDASGVGLRLGIQGGGCSGLSYVLELSDKDEKDTVLEFEGFQVYLDPKSTIYLSGVILDYQAGLQGKGFVFQNPMASNTCGCGESFSL